MVNATWDLLPADTGIAARTTLNPGAGYIEFGNGRVRVFRYAVHLNTIGNGLACTSSSADLVSTARRVVTRMPFEGDNGNSIWVDRQIGVVLRHVPLLLL